jgi:hypothetical protein
MTELSGPRLLKTKIGRKAALELVSSLIGLASPVLIVVEKRFVLGVYLASDFLDGTVNSAVPSPLAIDRATSRMYATALATLPEPILKIANAYLRDPCLEQATACLAAVIPALRTADQGLLADLMLTVDLDAGWKRVDAIRAKGLSPNVMAFTTLMQCLEILGLQCSRPIKLVHDESDQFQSTYDFYQRFAASRDPNGPHAEFFKAAGAPAVVKHVSRPSFRSSSHEPLIQAADLLVGLATSLLIRLKQNGSWVDDDEARLAILLLAGFFNTDLKKFFSFVGFHETGMQAGQAVVDAVKIVPPMDEARSPHASPGRGR